MRKIELERLKRERLKEKERYRESDCSEWPLGGCTVTTLPGLFWTPILSLIASAASLEKIARFRD